LNKGTDNKNLTYCASDYLKPSCSRLANLNSICPSDTFNYRYLRSRNLQTITTTTVNTPLNAPVITPVNVIIQNATGIPISNAGVTNATPITGVYSIPIRFNSILNNLFENNLYKNNKEVLFIPYFCDLKNYASGKPLFKSFNAVFNSLISRVISSIKLQADRLNLKSNNQAIHDIIQNYNYDFMTINMANSSFYDLYLKQSYPSNEMIKINEPIVNLNVSNYFNFDQQTTANQFQPKFREYLEEVRDNATNVAKDNYIRNCFTWVQNNLLRNSLNLNPLNLANYSNLVIQSNLEMSTNANAKMRFLQQAQDTLFGIIEIDPTAGDPVLSNFRQNVHKAYNSDINRVKNILRIDGSTVDAPANFRDVGSNIGSVEYFTKLNNINEKENLGEMSQNYNKNLEDFYKSRNQTFPADAIIIFNPSAQDQISMNIGAKFINTEFLLVFALLFFVLI